MIIEDGIYPVYVKDGVMYPIALTADDIELFKIATSVALTKIRVIKDKPIGKVINLK